MSWLDWFKPAPKAPPGPKPQPSVEEVKMALQRRYSRSYRLPDGTLATTAPPETLEAGPTGPTADWIARR